MGMIAPAPAPGGGQRIRVWIGGVPLELPTAVILDAVAKELPGWEAEASRDPALRVVMFGLKPIARGILAYLDLKAGVEPGAPALFGAPRPDRAEMKKNVTNYCIRYLTDIILRGLAWGDWIASYAETGAGALEITGLVAAADTAAGGRQINTVRTGAGAGDNAASDGAPGRADESQPGGALDDSGDDGLRQDDICEAAPTGVAEPVAVSPDIHLGQQGTAQGLSELERFL